MSQLMSLPPNQQSQSSCTNGKKCFQTEGEAVQFEITNRQKNNWQEQYPYLCDDCGFHHLTSTPTGDGTRSRVNYDEAAKYVVRTRRSAEEMLELNTKVRDLTAQGYNTKAIAEQLDISEGQVYALRNGKAGGLNKTVAGIEQKQLSIQERIAELQRELELEERRKQLMIEMRQLKVQWSQDENGERLLVITQDQYRFTVLPEDASKLCDLLKARLAEN